MNAIDSLKTYKKRVDGFLEKYFEQKIKEAKPLGIVAQNSVEIIKNFTLSGGKRIRPALVYYGFIASGGEDCDEIIRASMSIELAHTFLLIHDDIIDRDAKRHGTDTVHETYKKIAAKSLPKTDPAHFGTSMAIVAGDMAAAMSNEVIFTSKFQPEIIIKALNKLQEVIYYTIPGEMLDVYLEARGTASEEEITKMYEAKTARYTFEGPLQLGAVLAGKEQSALNNFSNYALPLGIAFQIRDDILGIFGNEKKLGKPVGSDIIEGKQTLLVARALKKASAGQKKVISECLGNANISESQIDDFRQVIIDTGSLDTSQKECDELIAKSLSALEMIDFKSEEAEKFLEGIAKYIIERQQ